MRSVFYELSLISPICGEDIRKYIQLIAKENWFEEKVLLAQNRGEFLWGIFCPIVNKKIAIVVSCSKDSLGGIRVDGQYSDLYIKAFQPMSVPKGYFLELLTENANSVLYNCQEIAIYLYRSHQKNPS